VRLALPIDVGDATARLLVSDQAIPTRVVDGWASLTVPTVTDHEVIVVE
jgi:hypothetical protein